MSRLRALGDALWRLGPRWLLFRLRDEVEQRTGRVERATPRRDWQPRRDAPPAQVTLVDRQALAAWLEENSTSADRHCLSQRVDAVRARRFDVFGVIHPVVSWHRDPSGHEYDRTAHWSHVAEPAGVDVKLVWEPSRFGWAYDLARAALVGVDPGAGELFWEVFTEWLNENPPNTGVNWKCGQESSIRMLAVVCTVQALPGEPTAEQLGVLEDFVVATADRVVAHIGYARSQNNNHLASEATGLLLAASLYPDNPRSRSWRAAAHRELDYVARELVFDDGGTSQYSMNYHRVFLDNLIVARLLLGDEKGGPAAAVHQALDRATRFADALVDPATGAGPVFGHDDGAWILPVAQAAHRDHRPTIRLGASLVDRPTSVGTGPHDEACAWFGVAPPASVVSEAVQPRLESFDDAGIHVLSAGDIRVFVRCGPFRFRPAHADQLNVEIWYGSTNVACDRGTFAYTAPPDQVGLFARSDHHNTIVSDDGDHMPQVGRFLWGRWNDGRVLGHVTKADEVSIVVGTTIGPSRLQVERRVSVGSHLVRIEDRAVDGRRNWSTVWHLLASERAPLELTRNDDDAVTTGEARAICYRQVVNDVTRIVRRPGPNGSVVSVFEAQTDGAGPSR